MLISPGREWQYALCQCAVISVHAITQPHVPLQRLMMTVIWHNRTPPLPSVSTRRGDLCSSHSLPPAHTLDGSAARISMQDFLMIWEASEEEKKHNHRIIYWYNAVCVCLSLCQSVSGSNNYTCVMYVSYRVNDSPQSLEASPYRKHMFHSVCNSCKL